MSHKTLICFVIVFFVFCSTNLFSAQYENYKWGISKKEAIKLVKNNGYKVLNDTHKNVIEYHDRIFGHTVLVTLQFTPKSDKLYGIIVKGGSRGLGSDLLKILKEKYGKASYLNEYVDEYYWKENEHITIVLMYDFPPVELGYISVIYEPIASREYDEIHKKEAKGKF